MTFKERHIGAAPIGLIITESFDLLLEVDMKRRSMLLGALSALAGNSNNRTKLIKGIAGSPGAISDSKNMALNGATKNAIDNYSPGSVMGKLTKKINKIILAAPLARYYRTEQIQKGVSQPEAAIKTYALYKGTPIRKGMFQAKRLDDAVTIGKQSKDIIKHLENDSIKDISKNLGPKLVQLGKSIGKPIKREIGIDVGQSVNKVKNLVSNFKLKRKESKEPKGI
jgi:hypothetical protein